MAISFGFPRMWQQGERRDFLPCVLTFLHEAGAGPLVLEHGYGSGMGIDNREYKATAPDLLVGTRSDCLEQDVVVSLRCPDQSALRRMNRGSCLVSMLHYATRPERVELLAELGIRGFSLDGMTDDIGKRLVENFKATAWIGVRRAFAELDRLYERFSLPGRRPLRVTVMGSGAVGAHAVHAATRYGDPELRSALVRGGVPGVEVTVIDFDLTWNEPYMLERLERTDILIDATQRSDQSRPVVPNEWIAALPFHAVLLDLAADPYNFATDPPRVKGIEGIPQGSLETWLFHPDHPAYSSLDPRVATMQRRMALSCDAWPGLEPRACMEVYSRQILPVLRVLIDTPAERLDPDRGQLYERAVARSEVSRWQPSVAA